MNARTLVGAVLLASWTVLAPAPRPAFADPASPVTVTEVDSSASASPIEALQREMQRVEFEISELRAKASAITQLRADNEQLATQAAVLRAAIPRFKSALALATSGQARQAEEAFTTIIRTCPTPPAPKSPRGATRWSLTAQALPLALALNDRGVEREAQGNHRGALDDFTRAIDLGPCTAVYYENRAATFQALGRTRQARHDDRTAVLIRQVRNGAHIVLQDGDDFRVLLATFLTGPDAIIVVTHRKETGTMARQGDTVRIVPPAGHGTAVSIPVDDMWQRTRH